jgi:hypothetical protein
MLSWCHVESTRTVSSQIDRLIDRQTDCPGISTRLWACEAGARPLEPCLQPVLLWLFWRKDPVYYAGQGFSYLKPLTHLVWCWFVINSLSWGMFLLFLVFQSFHHERMLNFVKGFFFCIYWDDHMDFSLILFMCVCWTILAILYETNLSWWMIFLMRWWIWLISDWEFLHHCSLGKLVYNFLPFVLFIWFWYQGKTSFME